MVRCRFILSVPQGRPLQRGQDRMESVLGLSGRNKVRGPLSKPNPRAHSLQGSSPSLTFWQLAESRARICPTRAISIGRTSFSSSLHSVPCLSTTQQQLPRFLDVAAWFPASPLHCTNNPPPAILPDWGCCLPEGVFDSCVVHVFVTGRRGTLSTIEARVRSSLGSGDASLSCGWR